MKLAPKKRRKVRPEYFFQNSEVMQCVLDLKKKFGENFEGLVVSDTMDEYGHQYVNLVQKGGGMLGVALVGYTYILEVVGIRFLRLAGTSAGAINTALMVAIGDKEDKKSERVMQYLCKLDFFNLVDGHPNVRKLIRWFITNKRFDKKVRQWFIGIIAMLIGLTIADFFFLVFRHQPWGLIGLRISYILTFLHLTFIGFLIVYGKRLLSNVREGGFGLNPGDYLFNWVKTIMEENGVKTTSDLETKAAKCPPFDMRHPETQDARSLKGDVTFITSEIVSQNKIEFPKMCNLFRENKDDLHPAHFVRASMSIPFFFESMVIRDIPNDSSRIKKAWVEHFGSDDDIPKTARFVDGGMMSNFPINMFYNPYIIEPRLPSFGIDLSDSPPQKEDQDKVPLGLGGYVGRLFDTIRLHYDKDFLIKNNVYKKGIGKIPLHDFNWLNFFISDEEKLKMFIRGAQAARDFLMTFDWAKYQQERIAMQKILERKPK